MKNSKHYKRRLAFAMQDMLLTENISKCIRRFFKSIFKVE